MLVQPLIAGTWLVKRESYELLMCLQPDQHYWMADNKTKSITIGIWSFELRENSPLLIFVPNNSDLKSDTVDCYFSNPPVVEVWELLAHDSDERITLRAGSMTLVESEEDHAISVASPALTASIAPSPRVPDLLPAAAPPVSGKPSEAQTRPINKQPEEQSPTAKLKSIYQTMTQQDTDFAKSWQETFIKRSQEQQKITQGYADQLTATIRAGSKTLIEAAYADARNGYSMVHPPRR